MGVVVHNSFRLSKAFWHSKSHLMGFHFLDAFSPEINLYKGFATCAYFLMYLQ